MRSLRPRPEFSWSWSTPAEGSYLTTSCEKIASLRKKPAVFTTRLFLASSSSTLRGLLTVIWNPRIFFSINKKTWRSSISACLTLTSQVRPWRQPAALPATQPLKWLLASATTELRSIFGPVELPFMPCFVDSYLLKTQIQLCFTKKSSRATLNCLTSSLIARSSFWKRYFVQTPKSDSA